MTHANPAHGGTQIARTVAVGLLPLPVIAAAFVGGPLLPVLCTALVFAALTLAARRVSRGQQLLFALVLVGECIALTAAFAGHAWQIDTHMLYFAVLAIVATMSSIPALLFACAVIAVHHLAFGLLLPGLVYPSADLAGNFFRTLIHAAVVVFEASVLIWSILRSAQSAAEIQAGRADLARSVEEASVARADAEAGRERAVASAERTRNEGQRAASAVEQITESANVTAATAAHAREVMAQARGDTDASGAIVQRAMVAMTAIEESSRRIGDIIGVIDEIARQTDLLALNAAVESARVGEAGRGFAVVASEVRKLAQRSADAMQQIRSLTEISARRVVEGVEVVSETSSALSRIGKAVADLDGLVDDIASGAMHQSAGLAEVNIAIARIDSMSEHDDNPHRSVVHPFPRRAA